MYIFVVLFYIIYGGYFMVGTALMRVRSGDYRAVPYLAASSF